MTRKFWRVNVRTEFQLVWSDLISSELSGCDQSEQSERDEMRSDRTS